MNSRAALKNSPTRCCGECKFAAWSPNGDGECYGGWWEYRDHRQAGRPWVRERPFLLSKGCGSNCPKWETKYSKGEDGFGATIAKEAKIIDWGRIPKL